MSGFGYPQNSSRNGNDWDLDAVVRFAYGDPLPQLPPTNEDDRVARFLPPLPPPTNNVPFTSFLLQQPQAQQHGEMPAITVDLPPPEPQPEDLAGSAAYWDDLDPLQQQGDLNDFLFDPLFPDMNVTVMTAEPSSGGGGAGSTSRSRRRRNNYRMVTRVLDGAPPPDTCSWRKYGQKSMKGSPNPRSYYKCSTDKQCKARKHVQRCGDDPRYLVVSYTRDHSHTTPLVRTSVVVAGANTTTAGVKPPPPPPSPLANITAVAQQDPAPSGDFNDTIALRRTMRLKDVDVTPEEDPVPFAMLDDEPQDGLLFYTADELAPVGGGGSNNNNLTFPMPYETAGGSSSGDVSIASTGVGTGTAPVVQAPVANVVVDNDMFYVDEMFYMESWGSRI